MVRKRRRHTPAYKFRVALQALEGSKTIYGDPPILRPRNGKKGASRRMRSASHPLADSVQRRPVAAADTDVYPRSKQAERYPNKRSGRPQPLDRGQHLTSRLPSPSPIIALSFIQSTAGPPRFPAAAYASKVAM